MFDEQAFQQDPLVESLAESGIVKRPVGDLSSPTGFVMINHNRNNNVKIQIKPKTIRPDVPIVQNQNPNTFVDDYRGEVNMCLSHANKFIISCAGAPAYFAFATSFGQMLVDLYRNTPNIEIRLNGDVHTADEFIKTANNTRVFDSTFMTPYNLSYIDTLGNYKLQVSGVNTVRFELRIYSPGNAMTTQQIQTLFGQTLLGDNPTAVYHSNGDFYGFTVCMEATSIPSVTKIDYATVETMDQLIQEGVITGYNSDATNLTIATVEEGVTSALQADFQARLLNEFDPEEVRLQDYLLVLEASGVDLSTVDLNSINITYSIYEKGQ